MVIAVILYSEIYFTRKKSRSEFVISTTEYKTNLKWGRTFEIFVALNFNGIVTKLVDKLEFRVELSQKLIIPRLIHSNSKPDFQKVSAT